MAAETADFVVEEVVGVHAPPELWAAGSGEYLKAELTKAGITDQERTPWTDEVIGMLARLFPPEAVCEVASWVRQARNSAPASVRLTITCPVPDCGHVLGKRRFLCKPHWRMVPRSVQRKVKLAQDESGTAVYVSAVLDAIGAATRAAQRRQAS